MLQILFFPFASLARFIGTLTLRLLASLGAQMLFTLDGLLRMFSSRRQIGRTIRQIYIIGAQSTFVILLVGLFTGMVMGLQGYYALSQFASEGFLGSAVALSLIRELGPVMTAIMVSARAGSAMAAEIGVMRISDQVDALDVLDISPVAFLVSPRILAALITFPMLTAIFDLVGILGGYIAGVNLLDVNAGVYFHRVFQSVNMSDVCGGFIKSIVFGLLVATISCYKGYFAHLRRDGVGPEAVSNATTSAVVTACVVVLAADYILTSFLL